VTALVVMSHMYIQSCKPCIDTYRQKQFVETGETVVV